MSVAIKFPEPELIGHIKRFGAFGPAYEIMSVARKLASDWMLKIRLIETSEEMEYKYSHAKDDPEAK